MQWYGAGNENNWGAGNEIHSHFRSIVSFHSHMSQKWGSDRDPIRDSCIKEFIKRK